MGVSYIVDLHKSLLFVHVFFLSTYMHTHHHPLSCILCPLSFFLSYTLRKIHLTPRLSSSITEPRPLSILLLPPLFHLNLNLHLKLDLLTSPQTPPHPHRLPRHRLLPKYPLPSTPLPHARPHKPPSAPKDHPHNTRIQTPSFSRVSFPRAALSDGEGGFRRD